MVCYSAGPIDRAFVKGYLFLSFAKKLVKIFVKICIKT